MLFKKARAKRERDPKRDASVNVYVSGLSTTVLLLSHLSFWVITSSGRTMRPAAQSGAAALLVLTREPLGTFYISFLKSKTTMMFRRLSNID